MSNQIVKYMLVFFLGSFVEAIVLTLRYMNPVMRKELILFMQQGQYDYFMMFAILSAIPCVIAGLYLLYQHRKCRIESKGESND